MILFFGMMHQEPVDTIRDFLKRSYNALVPGGVVYVMDMMTDASQVNPPFSAMFAVNMALQRNMAGSFQTWNCVAGWRGRVSKTSRSSRCHRQCRTGSPTPANHNRRELSRITGTPLDEMVYTVANATRKTTIGRDILLANASNERRTGLLKKDSLAQGSGLWIDPCEGIHTFFMRFAIDVIFLDRQHRVRKIRSGLRPWRLSACISAKSVLELPAGTAQQTLTEVGDQLLFKRP